MTRAFRLPISTCAHACAHGDSTQQRAAYSVLPLLRCCVTAAVCFNVSAVSAMERSQVIVLVRQGDGGCLLQLLLEALFDSSTYNGMQKQYQ